MSYACANLVSKANFNLINRTGLFICLHIMFQISFQNSKGQKSFAQYIYMFFFKATQYKYFERLIDEKYVSCDTLLTCSMRTRYQNSQF